MSTAAPERQSVRVIFAELAVQRRDRRLAEAGRYGRKRVLQAAIVIFLARVLTRLARDLVGDARV